MAQLLLTSGSLVQLLARSAENLAYFLHSTLSLAQPLEKPYPFWHTFGVQNPTLSGTLLENPTLCGTEDGQNGTLANLVYTCCRQWECPPPRDCTY